MENSHNEIEVTVSFHYQKSFSLNPTAKLVELKKEIEKEFLMKEDEYELYLNGYQLVLINNDATISSLFQQHNSSEFEIKSIKNSFDLKHQLYEIRGFLENKLEEDKKELVNMSKLYEEYKNFLEI